MARMTKEDWDLQLQIARVSGFLKASAEWIYDSLAEMEGAEDFFVKEVKFPLTKWLGYAQELMKAGSKLEAYR